MHPTSATRCRTGRRSSRRGRPRGAERGLHRARRRRVLGDGLLRRADRDAEHRPDRRDGVRYTQWHTTALCSPTRSCLLTGRNHTRNSMACITEAASGFPNASGAIPPENGHAPGDPRRARLEHLHGRQVAPVPGGEMNLASTRRNWPTGRGFERFYGFLGAETNQWYPDLVYDNHPVDQPRDAEEGYHFSEDITDKALEFIKDAKAIAPDKPFFLYYAPGACHARTTPPRSGSTGSRAGSTWATRRCAEQTLARQKEMGIVPPDTELPPINPIGTPETRTGPNGQPFPRWTSRGRGTRSPTTSSGCSPGWPRSTPGSSPTPTTTDRPAARLPRGDRPAREHDGHRRLRQRRQRRGRPQRLGQREQVLQRDPRRHRAEPGDARRARRPQDLQPLPERLGDGVQHAVQDVEALRVQRRHVDPCIISWPAGIEAKGEIRDQYHHAIDLVPTVLDALGVEPPETIKGHVQSHFDGVSMRYSFDAGDAPSAREDAVLLDARLARDLARRLEGRHHPPDAQRLEQLQRGHLGALPHRRRPLRAARPRRRAAREAPRADQPLVRRGRRQRRFPLDDRGALEISSPAAAELSPARDRYVYYPGVAEVPESRRSTSATARSRSARWSTSRPRGRGRAVRARLALRRPRPLRQGQPAALRQQLRRQLEQRIDATEDLPTGET